MSAPRALMLVSERADGRLRQAVREGRRPCPEYLRLEARHGVELLDWSRLVEAEASRTPALSARHALTALRSLRGFDVVFSDGEHVGIPLALGLRVARLRIPHLMIGHHLSTRAKRPFFRHLRVQAGITRVLVHSRRQLELARSRLGIPASKLRLVPYFADASFWVPQPGLEEEGLVVAAGRDHRDYSTLARACEGLPVRVVVAAGSFHSPAAAERHPGAWPANFEVGFADHRRLRELYARASVVVVPVLPTDFQAGVTTALEAMAMGRAVVMTATEGRGEAVVDGETGVLVPPADPARLRSAIAGLLGDWERRRRLGTAARRAVEERFDLDRYADDLARHLTEVASGGGGS